MIIISQKREPLLWKKLNFQAVIKSAASAASPEGFGRGKAGQAQGLGPRTGPGLGPWPFLFQILPGRLR